MDPIYRNMRKEKELRRALKHITDLSGETKGDRGDVLTMDRFIRLVNRHFLGQSIPQMFPLLLSFKQHLLQFGLLLFQLLQQNHLLLLLPL